MLTTPRSGRVHIAILGRRNAGKSSLINALAGQETAIVSPSPGTTTDPVYKTMELLPLGPVMLIDTAGLDDVGDLGELRVKRSKAVLQEADIILVVGDERGFGCVEKEVIDAARAQSRPVLAVVTKSDLLGQAPVPGLESLQESGVKVVQVSAHSGQGIWELKNTIARLLPDDWEPPLISDIISTGDLVILVTPIDAEAPKKRLILPQVQTLRDIIDHGGLGLVVQPGELSLALKRLNKPPRLVITDSQAFAQVAKIVPRSIELTSFSILFARYKGNLEYLVQGVKAILELRPGDNVLVAEACTHHPIGEDIGRVKIPRWLNSIVGGELNYTTVAGRDFPDELSKYRLVVHCGGCMINRTTMQSRLATIQQAEVPAVNYGVLIAYVHGILPRALQPFGVAPPQHEPTTKQQIV